MIKSTMAALAIGVLFAVANVSVAEAGGTNYYNGYAHGGYTYNDGYWWKDGLAYERVTAYREYCQNGYRYSQPYYTYKQVAVATKKVYISKEDLSYKKTDDRTEGWREKLLEIARARDAWEGANRASALEHSEFIDSVRLLGLEGNFKWDGYGYEMTYSQGSYGQGPAVLQQQGYSQLTAPQGATIYGYRQIADVYGNVNLGEIYNSVLRLRQQSYANEAQATSETHALVDNLGSRAAQIKEIEAKAHAAATALQAAEAKDSATLLQEFWQQRANGGGGDVAPPPAPGTGASTGNDTAAQFSALVQNKCVACHNAQKQNGGLDLSNLAAVSVEQAKSMIDRIKSPDETKRMPLGPDNSPGTPLTEPEIALFYAAVYPN